MTGGLITPEEAQAAAEAYALHGTYTRAAESLGMARTSFQRRIEHASRLGLMLSHPPAMPGYRISQVNTNARGAVSIQQRPDHGEPFAVPAGHLVKGVSALVAPDGREVLKWVKTNRDAENTEAYLRTVVDELRKDLTPIAPTPPPPHCNELLLNQYTVTDLHFGMLAWAEETRNANYDLKIAERTLLDWFAAAIGMSPRAKVGILAQLGDLIHHDSHDSVTPVHRNQLDSDSRLQKVVRVVIRVLRQVISMMLQHHEHVHIIMAAANHDPAGGVWLREVFHSFLTDGEPRITVDNSPHEYYAYEWGKTALFYHHGHRSKIGSIDQVFAATFREIYGRTTKAYGHIGHLHKDVEKPDGDRKLMKVEMHRTLAPPDAYAASGGWISNQDAKVIYYHRKYGEVGRHTLSPQMVSDMARAEKHK